MQKSTFLTTLGIFLFFTPMIIFSIAASVVYKADLPEYQVPCNVHVYSDVPCYNANNCFPEMAHW